MWKLVRKIKVLINTYAHASTTVQLKHVEHYSPLLLYPLMEWGKLQDGWVQSFLLQYFEPQIFACVVLPPSGVGMDDGAGLPAELPKSDYNFYFILFLLSFFPLLLCLLLNVVIAIHMSTHTHYQPTSHPSPTI